MNVVDSSAWLAYLAGERNAGFFAPAIEATEELIVPTICVYEVFKVVLREKDEDTAFQVASSMQQGKVVELDAELAMEAAALGLKQSLPLADSIIYQIARRHEATLWTQDDLFKGLANVRFRRKA